MSTPTSHTVPSTASAQQCPTYTPWPSEHLQRRGRLSAWCTARTHPCEAFSTPKTQPVNSPESSITSRLLIPFIYLCTDIDTIEAHNTQPTTPTSNSGSQQPSTPPASTYTKRSTAPFLPPSPKKYTANTLSWPYRCASHPRCGLQTGMSSGSTGTKKSTAT